MSRVGPLLLAAACASLAFAAGDRDAATIDGTRASFTFDVGKVGDYALKERNLIQKVSLKGGALVAAGTGNFKIGGYSLIDFPTTMFGPYVSDLVVDVSGIAGHGRAAYPPRAIFGLEDDQFDARAIVVEATPAGVSAYVADDSGAVGPATQFTATRLVLHVEREDAAVVFEAGPEGQTRTPLGAVAHDFGSATSTPVLRAVFLKQGESVAFDSLTYSGAVNADMRQHLTRMATVLGLERDARDTANATTAAGDLDTCGTVYAAQIVDCLSEKGGSPPAVRRALSSAIARMKAGGKLVAKAKKLMASGKDPDATIDAAIDATLAAGHVLRGMSVAEPWDPGP